VIDKIQTATDAKNNWSNEGAELHLWSYPSRSVAALLISYKCKLCL